MMQPPSMRAPTLRYNRAAPCAYAQNDRIALLVGVPVEDPFLYVDLRFDRKRVACWNWLGAMSMAVRRLSATSKPEQALGLAGFRGVTVHLTLDPHQAGVRHVGLEWPQTKSWSAPCTQDCWSRWMVPS